MKHVRITFLIRVASKIASSKDDFMMGLGVIYKDSEKLVRFLEHKEIGISCDFMDIAHLKGDNAILFAIQDKEIAQGIFGLF